MHHFPSILHVRNNKVTAIMTFEKEKKKIFVEKIIREKDVFIVY